MHAYHNFWSLVFRSRYPEKCCYFLTVATQNAKLKKSLEHVHALEEKLQNAFNENAKLKVKQKEDEKLWKGLESKFSSTKTLCDQLTETLQQLSGLVQAGRTFFFVPLSFLCAFDILIVTFFSC